MQKELGQIMAENLRIMERLSGRLHTNSTLLKQYSKQQMSVLIRVYLSGKSKLKDIAAREYISTANLCIMFRKLEQSGLVLRVVDEKDRRDTWYSVTTYGKNIAEKFLQDFLLSIENLFEHLSKDDEKLLINATKTINGLLKKVENA